MKEEVNSVDYTICDLRKNFDELTDMLIYQLNKFNRVLRNIEKKQNKAICYNQFSSSDFLTESNVKEL